MAGGMHGRGYAWQGACMAGGVHGQGVCMAGACIMEVGCMAGQTSTAAGGTHPTRIHSCCNSECFQ